MFFLLNSWQQKSYLIKIFFLIFIFILFSKLAYYFKLSLCLYFSISLPLQFISLTFPLLIAKVNTFFIPKNKIACPFSWRHPTDLTHLTLH